MPKGNMLISELKREYVYLNSYNKNSERLYDTVLNGFVSLIGDIEISKIDIEVVIKWKDHYFNSVSRETYRTYLRHLKTLFNYAVDEKYIEKSKFGRLKYPPGYSDIVKKADDDSFKKSLLEIRQNPSLYNPPVVWYLATKTLAYMGLRTRQLVTLKWKDVNIEDKKLLLRAEGSKTHVSRLLPIPDILIEDFIYYENYLLLFDYYGSLPSLDEEQVFNVARLNPRYKGTISTVEQFGGFYSRLSKSLPSRVTPKRLRHSFASKGGNLGDGSAFALMELLTHKSINTTMRYVNTSSEKMEQVINSIKY